MSYEKTDFKGWPIYCPVAGDKNNTWVLMLSHTEFILGILELEKIKLNYNKNNTD